MSDQSYAQNGVVNINFGNSFFLGYKPPFVSVLGTVVGIIPNATSLKMGYNTLVAENLPKIWDPAVSLTRFTVPFTGIWAFELDFSTVTTTLQLNSNVTLDVYRNGVLSPFIQTISVINSARRYQEIAIRSATAGDFFEFGFTNNSGIQITTTNLYTVRCVFMGGL